MILHIDKLTLLELLSNYENENLIIFGPICFSMKKIVEKLELYQFYVVLMCTSLSNEVIKFRQIIIARANLR